MREGEGEGGESKHMVHEKLSCIHLPYHSAAEEGREETPFCLGWSLHHTLPLPSTGVHRDCCFTITVHTLGGQG